MKVIIASAHCTKVDLIEYQFKSIKKFIKDLDYSYYIFNDAEDCKSLNNFCNINAARNIEDKCKEMNINHVRIPQELHKNRRLIFPNCDQDNVSNNHVCCRAALSVQYIYNYFKNENVILLILESDMFFIKDICLENCIGDKLVVFHPQSRNNIEYMWIGILLMNLSKMKNKDNLFFDTGRVEGVSTDSGGYSYHYLKNLEKNLIKYAEQASLDEINSINKSKFSSDFYKTLEKINNFHDGKGIFSECYLDYSVFHIRGFGSNWDYTNSHFLKYIEEKGIKYNKTNFEEKSNLWKEFCTLKSNIYREYINNL